MNDFDPAPAPAAATTQDDRTFAMLTHLSCIILGFIVPLIMWLVHKDRPDKAFVTDQAKEALNFQITLTIGYVIGMVLTIILIGGLINLVLWILCLVFSIIAALKAKEGVAYRYPFALRLIS
ncbi:DUF4870 domain-containing protein [Luteimonas sp. S4-F44]|uniref:DUF4870 domain-containing protein n=1 Tax=Luteimonas sp. S4-F44 TaxID=2925842 RepID=UPI001F52D526|nr:DUF4870 domain-containing protein [Luteimonas sp. S4-F44]UNK41520.1 DUF4870 domain-containing protein [Luteimonas sp. S4-F44]